VPMNKILLASLLFSLSSLAFVIYDHESRDLGKETAQLENKIKQLSQDLSRLTDKYKALQSRVPVPIEDQLERFGFKLTQLDDAVTDQSDLLAKIDPNGIIADTENWISNSHNTLLDSSENGWTRVSSAQVLKNLNRLDDESIKALADIYIEAERGHLRARSLSTMGDNMPAELKEPVVENLKRLMKEPGKYNNDWLRSQSVSSLSPYAEDPEVREIFLELATNDQNIDIARAAAEAIGLEIEE